MSVLGKKIAQRLSVSADRGETVLKMVSQVIKDEILQGNNVQLPEIGKLAVEQRKGEIVADPETGIRQVLPVRRVLTFNALDEMVQAVERMRLVNILLVVPKNDFFARTVKFNLAQKGYTVHIETTVDDAIDFIELQSAHMVILDARLEGTEDISERVKCYRDTSLIPVIEIFPKGTDPDRAHEFLVAADAYLVEPFDLDSLIGMVEDELTRVGEEEVLFEQQFHIKLTTTEDNIERINNIGNVVFQDSGLDEEGQTAMSAALREAVGNAAQHGNKDDPDKRIEVLYLLDKEKITISIADDGEGFEHDKYIESGTRGSAVVKARNRHKEGRAGGLGIMLMLKCVDGLEYNTKGNEITITKYIHASPQSS